MLNFDLRLTMGPTSLHALWLLVGLALPTVVSAQSPSPAAPVSVALCDLLKNPKTYDGRRIEIRGKISLDMEDFTIYDPSCNTWPGLWLMFGGDVSTPTKSTVNDNDRRPGQNIKVNGIEYELLKDANEKEFLRVITAGRGKKQKPLYRVTVTLIGTFLAGRSKEESKAKGMPDFPGYGHMGCCHLFIIQQVSAIETKPRENGPDEKYSTFQEPKP
jgi:hypothetical protein